MAEAAQSTRVGALERLGVAFAGLSDRQLRNVRWHLMRGHEVLAGREAHLFCRPGGG